MLLPSVRCLLVVAMAASSTLAACDAAGNEAPPSPLGTPATVVTAPTVAPLPPSTPSPLPTTTSPDPAATVVAGAAALESATGQALELLAEWLGIAQTELTVAEAESVVWPDGCLGIDRPMLCTQALVPGFRVVLADAFGGLHAVHGGERGIFVWAGYKQAIGSVLSYDAGARVLTLGLGRDTGDATLVVREAPGTARQTGARPPPADLAEGERVVVGYEAAPDGSAGFVLAWLVSLDQ